MATVEVHFCLFVCFFYLAEGEERAAVAAGEQKDMHAGNGDNANGSELFYGFSAGLTDPGKPNRAGCQ